MLAGLFYLIITVPLTHMVNYVDVRYRTGRRRLTAPQSGLKEVEEVRAPGGALVTHPRIGGNHE